MPLQKRTKISLFAGVTRKIGLPVLVGDVPAISHALRTNTPHSIDMPHPIFGYMEIYCDKVSQFFVEYNWRQILLCPSCTEHE